MSTLTHCKHKNYSSIKTVLRSHLQEARRKARKRAQSKLSRGRTLSLQLGITKKSLHRLSIKISNMMNRTLSMILTLMAGILITEIRSTTSRSVNLKRNKSLVQIQVVNAVIQGINHEEEAKTKRTKRGSPTCKTSSLR